MNTNRTTAIMVGVLFLVATVTTAVGDSLVASILSSPDYLVHMYPNRAQVITGVLIVFIDAVAVLGIAVLLFPVLKKHNEANALGYVGVRTAEFPLILVWLLSPLLLVALSKEYVNVGDPDALSFQTLGAVLIAVRLWSWRLIYLVNGIATLMLAYILFRSRLVPRSLAILGLIGGVVLLAGTAMSMFDLIDVDQGAGLIAVVPGGLFELLLPIWLIFKGFNSSAIASESAKTVASPV